MLLYSLTFSPEICFSWSFFPVQLMATPSFQLHRSKLQCQSCLFFFLCLTTSSISKPFFRSTSKINSHYPHIHHLHLSHHHLSPALMQLPPNWFPYFCIHPVFCLFITRQSEWFYENVWKSRIRSLFSSKFSMTSHFIQWKIQIFTRI